MVRLGEKVPASRAQLPWPRGPGRGEAESESPMSQNPVASNLLRPLDHLLRGIGQIVLQNSPWTGLAIVCALLVQAPILALGCALGALSGNAFGRLIRLPITDAAAGLHGFNGALVGIAGFVFFPESPLAWVVATLGAALSTLVAHIASRFLPVPAFTGPFVVVTWLALLALGLPTSAPALPIPAQIADAALGVLPGIGQIVFASEPLAGALILIGIAQNSYRDALFALAASILGALSALVFDISGTTAASGLIGYSAALTAIALAPRGLGAATLGIVATLCLQHLGARLSFPVLTAPFVLATWGVLLPMRRGAQGEAEPSSV